MRSRLWWAIGALVLVILMLGGCLPVAPADVAGGWTGTLTWSGAPIPGMAMPLTLALTQDNRTVSGEVGLMGPGSTPFSLSITAGSVDGKTVSLAASGTLQAGSTSVQVTITLSGECDGTHMTGTGTQTNDGVAYAFTWEAELTTPPADGD